MSDIDWDTEHTRVTIIVHPLEKNKRPIGFAPWPTTKKKTKKKRAKK